ncbi:MAG: DNA-processing protein DprA, partial [Candidatus Neomicrothrix subdominans]
LARVKLSCTLEPGDPRTADLIAEIGATNLVSYLEAAADNHAYHHGLGQDSPSWAVSVGRELARVDPQRVLDQAAAHGIRFIAPGDNEWPHQLHALQGVAIGGRGGEPIGLWVKGTGDLRHATATAVAVIGSRATTTDATRVAGVLARDLALTGRAVASSIGYGIDQAAHRGALDAGGATIAVLPCGVDRAYPAGHAALIDTIARRGLVVSENPPGVAPNHTRFLATHRLTAALTQGTVVVDAHPRSGTMNTAHWAHTLHRPVMTPPGTTTGVASPGVRHLIREGRGRIITNAHDIVAHITHHARRPPVRPRSPTPADESWTPARTDRPTAHTYPRHRERRPQAGNPISSRNLEGARRCSAP